MQNGDKPSPSIIFAGQALLVKMLIPLEPCGAFGSNFVNLCILTLSSHWYAKLCRGCSEHHLSDQALLVKMLITLGPHGIFGLIFLILMYFEHCQATDMQNVDEASPSIILAGRALLM